MDQLSQQIREKVLADVLPRFGPDITGYHLRGDGDRCSACGQAITADEFEREVYCWRDPELITIRMHDHCYNAWRQVSHTLVQLGH